MIAVYSANSVLNTYTIFVYSVVKLLPNILTNLLHRPSMYVLSPVFYTFAIQTN